MEKERKKRGKREEKERKKRGKREEKAAVATIKKYEHAECKLLTLAESVSSRQIDDKCIR